MQFELVEKELEFGLWLGITRKDYGATITGGQINVDHLHGADLTITWSTVLAWLA